MNLIHVHSFIKKLLAIFFGVLLITSCDWFESSSTNLIKGNKYKVTSSCVVTDALPENNWLIGIESNEDDYMCSATPLNSYQQSWASGAAEARLREQAVRDELIGTNYSCTPKSSSLYESNSCYVKEGTASITSPLVFSEEPTGYGIIKDRSLSLLHRDDHADIVGEIESSHINIRVKFLRTRSASTNVHGNVYVYGGLCEMSEECPILLKYMNFKLDDFTIVRPTIFARDVKVKDAYLYITQPILGIRRGDGTFVLDSAQLILSGFINGEEKVLEGELTNRISGRVEVSTNNSGTRYNINNFLLSFRMDSQDVNIDADISIRAKSVSIKPRITKSCTSPICAEIILSSEKSLIFHDDRITSQQWYDPFHNLIGKGNQIRVNPETRFPVYLEIATSSGRKGRTSISRPQSLLDPSVFKPNFSFDDLQSPSNLFIP